ncbi:MAG: FAD-binding protein [Chloroflexi bacterium]|nr:FAD-binding protein [Chloroflexota bacterium]
MTVKSLADQVIDTDVLVIGGGAGGCFAAIAACDLGADVVVFEKAAIRRSGNLATGVDDGRFAHPEITVSPEVFVETTVEPMEGMVDPKLVRILAEECYDRVQDLERMGVKMREDDGSYKRFPNRHPAAVWFRGADLKLRMSDEVRRRNIKVIERTVGTRLLTDGNAVVGATGVNVRDGRFVVCKAKAVVLTTGGALRLNRLDAGLFMTHLCAACSGDGIAMSYHAGAELTGMEFKAASVRPANPRIIPALGSVLDAGVPVVDGRGERVMPAFREPAISLGEVVLEREKAGKGPLYWDFPALSEAAQYQFVRAMMNERPICIKMLKEDGVDLRRDRVEIFHIGEEGIDIHMGGIIINEECQSSVDGLYAAGDTISILGLKGNSALSAMTLGHRAGRYAATRAKQTARSEVSAEQVSAEKQRAFAPLARKEGPEPVELEEKVRGIVSDYCGVEKSGVRLNRGLELLLKAKDTHLDKVVARNPHHLMRFVELSNIFDVAEMHMRASLMREESRLGLEHHRIDFPKRDDTNWRKLIVVRKVGGEMTLQTRETPDRKGGE